MEGVGHQRLSRQAADHFDQRHLWDRIEKVHSGEPTRRAQRRSDRRHRDRRGVGREQAGGRHDGFERAEQLLLGDEVFDDRLDHQAAGGEFVQTRRGDQAGPRRLGGIGVDPSLFGQPVEAGADAGDRLLDSPATGVIQQHAMSGSGRHLRDAAAHGAGADDGDRRVDGERLAHVAYSPVKFGARRVMNAVTPSR